MNCARFVPYLSAGPDEVDRVTAGALEAHVASCAACRAESLRFATIRRTLLEASELAADAPDSLVPAILASTVERRHSGATAALLPIPPVELARVLQENREVIVGAGAAAVVAAGAAWAIWRGLRSLTRPGPQRA